MSPGPDDTAARWIARRLPGRALQVALLGDPPPDLRAALDARAELVAVRDPDRAGAPTPDAVVAEARGGGEAEQSIVHAASLLSPRGRLLLVLAGDAAGVGTERLACRLIESGFAPRGEPEPLAGGVRGVAADFDGFTVRPYRPGDEEEILELFRRSFHVDRDPDHWLWKYARNPEGGHRISLARDPAGKLVGQYCAYPVRLLRDGVEQIVHQVGDTMTAADVRGVGRGPTSVLARTARHFYETFCRGRVLFNYGFNTGNIQKFSIRFVGAHKVEEAPHRVRELADRPLRPPRRWGAGGWAGERVVGGLDDDELDRLWRDAAPAYGSLVVRDARALRWRYRDCPDRRHLLLGLRRRGRLVGWGVFLRRDRELVWGDALFLPERLDGAEALLAEAARRLGGESPVERVVGWFPPRPAWLARGIAGLGFEPRPEPQQLALMVVPFDDPRAAERCAADFHYSYGDSDLF